MTADERRRLLFVVACSTGLALALWFGLPAVLGAREMHTTVHTILDATVKAAGSLCLVGIAWLVYEFGRGVVRTSPDITPLRCYAGMLFGAAVLGFVFAFNLGRHVEHDDPTDMIDGGGGRVVEDYGATGSQRLEEGVETFVEVGVLLIAGARRGFREPARRRDPDDGDQVS